MTVWTALGALAGLAPAPAAGQSAADLSGRLRIDADLDDWTAAEAVFLPGEEPQDDARTAPFDELQQVRVTWDAQRLYVAVEARVESGTLLVGLDFRPGGLEDASALNAWRRALRFGTELRPDALLAVGGPGRAVELWLVEAEGRLQRVEAERFAALARFEIGAAAGALEAALPWPVLFPDAPLASDPEPGAPAEPVFVLPEASSRLGLRLAAVIAAAPAGQSGFDIAPDNRTGLPADPRQPVVLDRAARLDWDAAGGGPPHFVDFGAAVQTQAAPRFVPPLAAGLAAALRLGDLRTFVRGPSGLREARLVPFEAGFELGFGFDVQPADAGPLFVSATVWSLHGERVRQLVRDARREPGPPAAPLGAYGDALRDRWDGRDDHGFAVPGGMYVLRVALGTGPGQPVVQAQRPIAVVR
jgi:hypothetical protein